MNADPDFDVIIIGAGLGGSAVLHSLRNTGLRILHIERGSYLKQEPENWNPHDVITLRRYDPEEKWVDNYNLPFTPRTYYNVGGSSKFFGGVALRFRKEDFEIRSYPEGATEGWPITYDDLSPYYEEAERLMWVHGKSGDDMTEPPRKAYAKPPLEHEPMIRWLAKRFSRFGLHPFALPMAIDQGPKGRCQKGSPCDGFPCKIRAKGDGENSFCAPLYGTEAKAP